MPLHLEYLLLELLRNPEHTIEQSNFNSHFWLVSYSYRVMNGEVNAFYMHTSGLEKNTQFGQVE